MPLPFIFYDVHQLRMLPDIWKSKFFLIKGVVAELQGAEFADFSKLRHPSWSTTAEKQRKLCNGPISGFVYKNN